MDKPREPMLTARPTALAGALLALTACASTPPLTDRQFDNLSLNVTNQTAVRASLGEPWRTLRFDRTATTAWDYRYTDDWGYRAEYSLIFDAQGVLIGKHQARLDGRRDRF